MHVDVQDIVDDRPTLDVIFESAEREGEKWIKNFKRSVR